MPEFFRRFSSAPIYRAAAKLGWYGLTVAVGMAINILAIPIVVRVGGSTGWASVVVGQGLGSFLNTFTYLGWLLKGPSEIAVGSKKERGREYSESLWLRGLAFIIVGLVAVIIVLALRVDYLIVALLACASLLVQGLSASWFYVGEGQPKRLFFLDTIPRNLGILGGVLLSIAVNEIHAYVAIWLLGCMLSVTLSSIDIRNRYREGFVGWPGFQHLLQLLRQQVDGIATGLLTNAYVSLPVVFVQATGASGVAVFGLADKLKQFALSAVRPVGQVLQGWTPSRNSTVLGKRAKSAWSISVVLGGLSTCAYILCVPWLGGFFGGNEITLDSDLVIPIGLSFGAAVVTQCSGVASLVPLGKARLVSISAAIGSIVVLGGAIPAAFWAGAIGVAWVVAIGQISVAVFQAFAILRAVG